MNEKAYCSHCRKQVAFHSKQTTRTTELDGIDYTYPVMVALCDECGKVATYKPYQERARLSFAETMKQKPMYQNCIECGEQFIPWTGMCPRCAASAAKLPIDSGVHDKHFNKLRTGDTVMLFDMRGTVTFEAGAYGIGFDEIIDWNMLQEKVKENTPNDSGDFVENDNFISFWELIWNFDCQDGYLDIVEIIDRPR